MKNLIKNTVLLFVIIIAGYSHAQTYPVQAFVQVSPPYNSYLPDYADPFTNQMRVLLTLTDFSVPSTQVKLRFKIEGSGYSMESVNLIAFPSITLTPGVPVEISGSDLAPYLATSNLVFSGLNAADYELNKVLPEGPATICVEVVDVTSANQPIIGNPACAQTWFSLYDPPLVNMPFCGTDVSPLDPQAILFSWTPLHMASPLAGSTEYIFELFEIRPDGGDPNVVVNSTLPIFIEITTNTFVNYGIIQPQLQVGLSYVWRVKARDPSNRNLYRNNGYSEVCTFTYGSIAGSLIGDITLELASNGTGVRQGLAWWNASDLFDSYTLEVRKTGNPDYEWFPYSATEGQLKVNSLEPSTEYECRVKGIAGGAETDWSNISLFTTQAQNAYACGSTVLPAMSPIDKPLGFLLPGNIVAVGQFEMQITAAEPTGFPGHFLGRGKINIPFILTNINVTFDDIYIDEDMVMRSGRVEAITDGIDAWLDEMSTIFIHGIINQPGGFEFNDDSTVTVFFGDESLTFDFSSGDPLVFEDESGIVYTVYSDGRIDIGGVITWDDDYLDATANHVITFSKYESQKYGFDEKSYVQWTRFYPCIKLSDGSLYFVPYKSVGAFQEDIVVANIKSEVTINSPTFRYADGDVLNATRVNDTTYHIAVGNVVTSKYIYAYDDLGAKIGKVILSVYAEKERDIVVVPVNGSEIPENLESYLNTTFKQANVSFNITTAENYTNNEYDIDGNGLEQPDATLMQKYSLEMRALRDAYFENHTEERNTYYLFIVPEIEGDFEGYMVRGKSLGFIEEGTSTRTYAHEIGHGAFGLEHTFPTIPTGTTKNLLDYTEVGNHLNHKQWLEIHDFVPVFSFLDDEEDGGMIIVELDLDDLMDLRKFWNADSSLTFLSVGGKPISLKGNITQLVFTTYEDYWFQKDATGRATIVSESSPYGTLHSFTIDNMDFSAKGNIISAGLEFIGYKNNDSIYTENYTSNLEEFTLIAGLPAYEDGIFVFKVFPSNYFDIFPIAIDENNKGIGTIASDQAYLDYMTSSSSEEAIKLFAKFGTTITEDAQFLLHQSIDYNLYGKDAMLALRTAHLLESFPIYSTCFTTIDYSAKDAAYSYLLDSLANATMPPYFAGVKDQLLAPQIEYLYDINGNLTTPNQQTLNSYESRGTYSSYKLNSFLYALEYYNSLAEKLKDGIDLDSRNLNIILTNYKQLNLYDYGLGDCAIRMLSFSARKQILGYVDEWTFSTQDDWFGDDRENLLVSIIELTPEDQYEEMLNLLGESNCALMNSMWSDIWFSHLDRLIAAISEMAIATKLTNDEYNESTLPVIPLYNDGVFWDWNETEYDWSNCSVEFQHDYSVWSGENYTVHPFDLVKVEVEEDFRFPLLGGTGQTLKEGQTLIVPAIWAYYILDKQNDVTNMALLRMLGDAIIIVGSGGTAAPFYVYAATADFIITGFENTIMSSDEYESLRNAYHIYDALALAVGGIEGLSQLKWFSKLSIANDFYRFGMSSNRLRPLLISAHVNISKRDEIITLLRSAITATTADLIAATTITKLRNGFITALVSMELSRNAPSITNAVIRIVQNDFVAIDLLKPINGHVTGDILPFANLIKNEFSGFSYHIDDIKWINAATETNYNRIIELYDVKYKNQLDELVTGNLEVVLLENGLVRVVEGAGSWTDEVFNIQKSVYNQNKNIIANMSSNHKGAWGEIATDSYLTEKGFQPLHPRKTALTDGWGETGIDGIFKKDGQYYIIEAKYTGYSTLNTTIDGKQLSKGWIEGSSRLENAVGTTISTEIKQLGYKKIWAKVAPNGSITFKEATDDFAKTFIDFTP